MEFEMKNMNRDAALSASVSIFLYDTKEYKDYIIDNDTCSEKMCQQICKDLEMKPLVCILFALRSDGTTLFLPGCRKLEPNNKYNFRLRFQIKSIPELKTLDKNAYDYLYQQVNWDLINGTIPELVNPNCRSAVFGLCTTNMYVELLEKKASKEQLIRNCKKYVPRQSNRIRDFLVRRQMVKELKEIKNMTHDVYYVKTSYLQGIAKCAPNYFVEKCGAIAPYLAEDDLGPGTCPVELEFSPFHPDRPGLSIYYSYRQLWQHIATIDDIFAVHVNGTNLTFETRFSNVGYSVTIADQSKLESFVSCITGYYRLMVKWTVDLCESLKSPLLQELKDLKCHGPIGADFSYFKLHEQKSMRGSYIIRQSEEFYDIYYIDIITKFVHPETYKITKQRLDGNITWNLHIPNVSRTDVSFNNLQHLARSIGTDSVKKFRLPPSDYDQAALLLLCNPLKKFASTRPVTVDLENQLRQKPVEIIDTSKLLRKFMNTKKIVENGIISQMQGEWLLPKDTKVDVTLKILNSNDHCSEFMKVVDKWSCLQSSDILKLYGLTLSSPYSMVIESTQLGPLDEFLQANGNISMVCRVDASYSLARALHHLEEKNIVHGNIRCASLYVVKFDGLSLVVRLGDPKLQNSYTDQDLPWIPVEYYGHMEQSMQDIKADIFAYATTTWQIFSNGIKPPIKNTLKSHRMLRRPMHCPNDMHELMMLGWGAQENRFSPHFVFSTLINIRDSCQKQYASIAPLLDNRDRLLSTTTNSTVMTDRTRLMSEGCNSNISCCDNEEPTKSNENISDYTMSPTVPSCSPSETEKWEGYVPNGSLTDRSKSVGNISSISNISNLSNISNISCYSDISSNVEKLLNTDNDDGCEKNVISIELEKGSRIIYDNHNYIGKGQYGTVFKGVMLDNVNCITKVAIKTLNNFPSKNEFRDFKREIFVMSKIEHPNIVKIITWTDEPHIAIIMNYVEHGSFHKYLSKYSESLDTLCLLRFAEDIAFGMEYLSNKDIVHRDLAARNVLIDSMNNVKISDFGLSQFVNDKGYYRSQNRRFIPYKWYAPETLTDEKYSLKSDVWSYGVTLFEIFSKGMDPNLESVEEGNIDDLVNCLAKGHRLPRPECCPKNVYNSVLLKCWKQNAVRRLSFKRILKILNEFIAEYENRRGSDPYFLLTTTEPIYLQFIGFATNKVDTIKEVWFHGHKAWKPRVKHFLGELKQAIHTVLYKVQMTYNERKKRQQNYVHSIVPPTLRSNINEHVSTSNVSPITKRRRFHTNLLVANVEPNEIRNIQPEPYINSETSQLNPLFVATNEQSNEPNTEQIQTSQLNQILSKLHPRQDPEEPINYNIEMPEDGTYHEKVDHS